MQTRSRVSGGKWVSRLVSCLVDGFLVGNDGDGE